MTVVSVSAKIAPQLLRKELWKIVDRNCTKVVGLIKWNEARRGEVIHKGEVSACMGVFVNPGVIRSKLLPQESQLHSRDGPVVLVGLPKVSKSAVKAGVVTRLAQSVRLLRAF